MIINIKSNIKLQIEFEVSPVREHWEEASIEEQNIYIQNRIKEFILENVEEIVEDFKNNTKLKIT